MHQQARIHKEEGTDAGVSGRTHRRVYAGKPADALPLGGAVYSGTLRLSFFIVKQPKVREESETE